MKPTNIAAFIRRLIPSSNYSMGTTAHVYSEASQVNILLWSHLVQNPPSNNFTFHAPQELVSANDLHQHKIPIAGNKNICE